MSQILLDAAALFEAVEYFLKAVSREPDVPSRYWNAALALERAKKIDLALQYATKYAAMETNPAGRQKAYGYIEHLKQLLHR